MALPGEIFLANMKMLRTFNDGFFAYEMMTSRGGTALLKNSPFPLKKGQLVNLFVKEEMMWNGKPIYIPLVADSPRSFKEGYAAIKMGGYENFINVNGTVLYDEVGFERVLDFSDGLAPVELDAGKWGFLRRDGLLLDTPPLYPFPQQLKKPLHLMSIGFNKGIAGMNALNVDKTLFPVLVKRDGTLVESVGQKVIDDMMKYSEGLAVFEGPARYENFPQNLYGFLDEYANVVIVPQFARASSFSEGLAAVVPTDSLGISMKKVGFIDQSGAFFIKPAFDDAYDFKEGFAAVKLSGGWGFINRNGTLIVKPQYQQVRSFSNGLAAVKRSSRWGYIDKTGKEVISPKFVDAGNFSSGLAPATQGGYKKWGYIDTRGAYVIKPRYEMAEPFSEGLALIRDRAPGTGGKVYKYLNTKGDAVLWFYAYN